MKGFMASDVEKRPLIHPGVQFNPPFFRISLAPTITEPLELVADAAHVIICP
jgi:hypothetical protein